MPAVRLFLDSTLTISFGLALEVTPLIGVLLMLFFQKENLRFRIRARVYVWGVC